MEPFEIHAADADLADLHQRLTSVRLSPPPAAMPWDSGVDYQYLSRLIDYWRSGFDWRRVEERLNAYPQFLASIGGQRVHFVHIRADRARIPIRSR